ncbi:hypothetical protein Tco_1066140 [Tanacetum coccineum]
MDQYAVSQTQGYAVSNGVQYAVASKNLIDMVLQFRLAVLKRTSQSKQIHSESTSLKPSPPKAFEAPEYSSDLEPPHYEALMASPQTNNLLIEQIQSFLTRGSSNRSATYLLMLEQSSHFSSHWKLK